MVRELTACVVVLGLVGVFYFPRFLPSSSLVLGDSLEQNVQHRVHAALALQAGRLPHWCDAVFGGYPFLSDPQTAVFFPPYLALSLLGVEAGSSRVFDTIALSFVFAGALGAYLLARVVGIGRIGAIGAGVFFGLNGYMVNHLSHTVISSAIACSVLGMAALVWALRREDRRWAAVAAMCFASAILAGHWQTAMFGFYAAGVGALFLVLRNALVARSFRVLRRGVVLIAVAFGLGVLGATLQILPTLEFLKHSTRAKVSLDFATAYSLPAKQLPGLLMPSLYQPLVWRIPAENRWELCWSSWGIDGSWEFQFWCGLIGFTLILFGWLVRAARPSAWLLMGALALTLVASLGKDVSLYKWFYHHLPGWKQIRIPPRMLWVGFLAGALLLGMGLDVVATRPRWPARRLAALLTAVLLVGLALGGVHVLLWAVQLTGSWTSALEMLFVINPLYRIGVHRTEADFLRDMAEQFAIGGSALGLALVWLFLVAKRRHPAPVLAYVAVLLMFGELAIYGVHKNVGVGKAGFESAVTPMHAGVPGRPAGRLHSFYPGPWEKNTGESSGIPYTGGYNPLQLAWVNPFVPPEESSRGRHARENGLDVWNVSDIAVPAGGVDLRLGSVSVHLSTGTQNVLLSQNDPQLPDELVFDLGEAPPLKQVHVVSGAMGCLGFEDGTTVGVVEFLGSQHDTVASAPLRLGIETAEWTYDQHTTPALVRHRRPRSAFTDFNEGHTTGGTTYFLASFEVPTTEVLAVRIRTELEAPRWLAVTHVITERDGNPPEARVALEGLGYRQLGSKHPAWIYLRRPEPPGWAWLAPNALPVSYKKNFQWVIQRYNDPAWDPRKVVLVDKHQLLKLGDVAAFNAAEPEGFAGEVEIAHPVPEHWRFRTRTNDRGWLVISQAWYPGWRATLDGVDVTLQLLRANGGHTALPVPPGEHVVELSYSTPWFGLGASVSALAWFTVVLMALVPLHKRHSHPAAIQ